MRRIGLAVVFAVNLMLAPLAAEAQQATGQRHRVGLLNGAGGGRAEAVFREGLYALGYVEGTNLVIDARAADGRVERLPILMRELPNADRRCPRTRAEGRQCEVFAVPESACARSTPRPPSLSEGERGGESYWKSLTDCWCTRVSSSHPPCSLCPR
jgi:hypothetical protein